MREVVNGEADNRRDNQQFEFHSEQHGQRVQAAQTAETDWKV